MEPLGIAVKVILVVTIGIDACLFLFILQRRKRGVMYTLLLVHLLGILGWAVSILMLLQTESHFWTQCAFASAIVLALSKFFFVLSFPENQLPAKSFYYWLSVPTAIALVASFVSGAFFTEVSVLDSYYVVIQNGPYASLYSLFISYLLIVPIYLLAKKYRRAERTSHTKEQLRYLLYGTSLFFVVGLAANSILPVFFNIYFFNGLGPSFSLILAGFIIFIISRHNFLEIKAVLQRSFVFSVLLSGIVLLYLSIIAALETLIHQTTETAVVASAGITTIVGIFSVPRIDTYLRKKTDRFFFKGRYNYRDALYRLSEEVNKNVHLDDIKKLTEQALGEILKTTTVVTIMASGNEPSQALKEAGMPDGETLTVPIILDGTLLGTIFLGEKKSGESYTEEDVVLIKTFSHHIAVAFEKARLYKEVQDYSVDLEKRVAERTEEVTRLQEQQASMMLDISHRLQNPLTIMKAELALLRDHMPERTKVAFFEKTIDDVSTFTYDLLRIAHLEATSGNLNATKLNVSEHLLELIEYIEVVAADRGIRLAHTVEPHVFLHCDKEKITELVTNLLSNAVKYIGDRRRDSKEIRVTLKKEGRDVSICIEDNGIGIAEADLPHIFDRFYRVREERHPTIRGSGLGLAICKRIVELHNGTISVRSEPNKGTCFSISLPNPLEMGSQTELA